MSRGNPRFLQNIFRFALYHLESSFIRWVIFSGEIILFFMVIFPSGICNIVGTEIAKQVWDQIIDEFRELNSSSKILHWRTCHITESVSNGPSAFEILWSRDPNSLHVIDVWNYAHPIFLRSCLMYSYLVILCILHFHVNKVNQVKKFKQKS